MAIGKIIFCDCFKGSKDGKNYLIYNGVAQVTYGVNTDVKLFSVFGNTGVVPIVGNEVELFEYQQNHNKETGNPYGDYKYRAMFIKDKDGRYLKV